MSELQQLHDAILDGDAATAKAVTEKAIADGLAPMDLITGYMMPAMDEVGRRFENEEYFVPELLLAARAMKSALVLLRPLLAASGTEPVGRVVIGTVNGDLHDIGKNLVASLLEGAGFEVHDLGADVPPEKFVAAAAEKNADILCLSALLTVTMPAMKTTLQAFRDAGVRDSVKVMIGGAPVTAEYATEIGADGFSSDAAAAVRLARSLVA
jgi:5-methyltetrahydrofolate--homocysteine methyltransferase